MPKLTIKRDGSILISGDVPFQIVHEPEPKTEYGPVFFRDAFMDMSNDWYDEYWDHQGAPHTIETFVESFEDAHGEKMTDAQKDQLRHDLIVSGWIEKTPGEFRPADAVRDIIGERTADEVRTEYESLAASMEKRIRELEFKTRAIMERLGVE